jgi:hypothetical protein
MFFCVPNESEISGDMLSAMGWDLRTVGEAQIRSITAMQRSIDDYRQTQEPQELSRIRGYLKDMQRRSKEANDSFADLLAIVAELEAGQPDAG